MLILYASSLARRSAFRASLSWVFPIALALLTHQTLSAQTSTLAVSVDKPLHPLSPTLYGIFFEDINCSADGGLYAEMVRNRNFEDSNKPDHWETLKGSDTVMSVESSDPVSDKNRRYLKVQVNTVQQGRAGVANEGFWGMGLNEAEAYEVSLYARGDAGFGGPLVVSLEGKDGEILAQGKTPSLGSQWKVCNMKLHPNKSDPQARLTIMTSKPGTFYLDMVSVFPGKTWKNRANGLRPDLAGMLEGMRPSFMRFPGGCWVEGETMDLAYRWKQTVGDPSERRTQYNIWQYHATHGLGYHEYLQMSEDLGAEPLFVINCGMSHREVIPLEKMGEFVQDALDAIEYANGPVTSQWGALRAQNHHPAPFHLRYMEIGNENGGRPYQERYALFYDAIKAKYPDMHLIADEWGGGRPTSRPVEIVDEHYYSSPEFFMSNAEKYDSYDRAGRKVYIGEYAVTQGCGQGNLRAAVGEAAFMTGMERNSDVVLMASYAPLFANVNYKKWNPDLIDFDSSRVYGLPSYYVQKMFSENRGDLVLPVAVVSPEVTTSAKSGLVGVGTWLTQAEFKDLRVTRDGQTLFSSDFSSTNGWSLHGGNWSVQDGALQQHGLGENIRAFAGDKQWKNYTYTLKARKVGGQEGFLIPFLVQDEEAKAWWNIGGWNNTQHALEMDGLFADGVPGKIETGRWYDIRIELSDSRIKCYLDDKLIHDVAYPRSKSLYATASKLKNGRELILKVVNGSRETQDTALKFTGAKLGGPGKAICLSSDRPEDENSLDQPDKVVPKTRSFAAQGSELRYEFPANSVTVLRLPLR